MHVSIDEMTTVARSEIPLVVAQFLAGRHTASARPPGLVTREDIIRIKLYVKQALTLPRGEAQVVKYLGYSKLGIAGLEPEDITVLFENIFEHAVKWPAIEDLLRRQSADMEIAAREITRVGNTIIEIINEMPSVQDRLQTIGEFGKKPAENLSYSSLDGMIAREVGHILERMRTDIWRYREETANVKRLVRDFKTELSGGELSHGVIVRGLEPTVKSMRDDMKSAGITGEIGSLQDQIDEMEGRVEELKRDYDKFVGLCFTGLAGGLFGLAITGGIFGAQAEQARKAKNTLIAEINRLRQHVGHKKKLQEAIDDLALLFSDIGMRMVDAESALGNLEFAWDQLLAEIEASQRNFAVIDDADRLILFKATFETVIQPWSTINGISLNLKEAIESGLAEYNKLYMD